LFSGEISDLQSKFLGEQPITTDVASNSPLDHSHHGFDTPCSLTLTGRLNQLHHLQAGWAGARGTSDSSRNHPATEHQTRPQAPGPHLL